MKKTNLKNTMALFFGTMAMFSCKDSIDVKPIKIDNGDGCESKGVIVKELFWGSTTHTGSYLVLDKELNEYYYPCTPDGQKKLRDIYSESGLNEIDYSFTKEEDCVLTTVLREPASTCVNLSHVNNEEIKGDNAK